MNCSTPVGACNRACVHSGKWSLRTATARRFKPYNAPAIYDGRECRFKHLGLDERSCRLARICGPTQCTCPDPPLVERKVSPLADALQRLNAAVFVIGMTDNHERQTWIQQFLHSLGVHGSRVHIVAAAPAAAFDWPVLEALARNGTLDSDLWARTVQVRQRIARGEHVSAAARGSIISPSRLAVLRSHQMAQRAFLSSNFKVGLFLEDDVRLEAAGRMLGVAPRVTTLGADTEVDARDTEVDADEVEGRLRDALLTRTSWQMLYLGYC